MSNPMSSFVYGPPLSQRSAWPWSKKNTGGPLSKNKKIVQRNVQDVRRSLIKTKEPKIRDLDGKARPRVVHKNAHPPTGGLRI